MQSAAQRYSILVSKLISAGAIWFALTVAATRATAGEEALPKVGDHSLRILGPNVLELLFINTKAPDPARVGTWDWVNSSYQFQAPSPTNFQVLVGGQPVPLQSVLGFKRRPLYAPLVQRDLRIQNAVYLRVTQAILDTQTVEVRNPAGNLWASDVKYFTTADPQRYSPVIHVNQEGYLPTLPKKAEVGYYLGSAGELSISSSLGFKVVDAVTGAILEVKDVKAKDCDND